jgi:hypothetical protein
MEEAKYKTGIHDYIEDWGYVKKRVHNYLVPLH